jgi:hypothetical protein
MEGSGLSDTPLRCPACARAYPASERFCPDCALPLVYAAGAPEERAGASEQPLDELWRRARRIKPQYSEGALVRVAGARNQTEADFIQGLLLEEGIPSLQRRARGFDVPDFLAAGPREVFVPASGAPAAQDVLLQSELIGGEQAPRPWRATAWRVMVGLLAGLALLGALAWIFSGH